MLKQIFIWGSQSSLNPAQCTVLYYVVQDDGNQMVLHLITVINGLIQGLCHKCLTLRVLRLILVNCDECLSLRVLYLITVINVLV